MKLMNGVDEVFEPDMGARVRAIRLSTGKSALDFQRWLVEHGIDVTYSTWKNYEKGHPMYWRTARRMCTLFPEIDMDYVYRSTERSEALARRLIASSSASAPLQPVPA